MVEIIGHLTKMRFGDQEQNRFKDTKEVCGNECSHCFRWSKNPDAGLSSRVEIKPGLQSSCKLKLV